jgi:hypothetical protein
VSETHFSKGWRACLFLSIFKSPLPTCSTTGSGSSPGQPVCACCKEPLLSSHNLISDPLNNFLDDIISALKKDCFCHLLWKDYFFPVS